MSSPLPAACSLLKGLKVCFLAGTLGQGGAERQLYYILKCLRAAGSDVALLSLTKAGYWEEPIRELGVAVEWVGQASLKLARLMKIIKVARRLKPQVVQSQHFFANGYAALTARVIGCCGIGAVRSNVLSEFRNSGPVYARLNLRLPRLIVANSREALGTLAKTGVRAGKLFYLPNVIDTDFFRPQDSGNNGASVILGVGRLVPAKRLDRFLQILADARKTLGPTVRGVIVGDGPLRPQLEAQAQALGLAPDTVVFSGSASDVRPCFRKGAILLQTSDYEGTPNVVMEAMACGVPVLATSVGGTTALIQDGVTGFLFERANSSGAASLLQHLIQNRDVRSRIARQARQFIEREHSLERLPHFLAELYDQATRAKR
jgi:glycosyltransferase involved in cell wall biosynthesis